MWYLNQLIQEIYGNGSYRTTQELLGMSLIELSSSQSSIRSMGRKKY